MILNFLKTNTSLTQRRNIKRKYKSFKSIFFANDLNALAKILGTDKNGGHSYTDLYKFHLEQFKNQSFNLLEIGVGGYDVPNLGGASLRMWKRYFSNAKIFGVDIYDKSALEENRIRIFKGSQIDKDFLDSICDEIGDIKIIIDDGSHINDHIIESFKILFPKLEVGGYYIIEDVQTAYWPEYGGSLELNAPGNLMTFFKTLIDGLNHKEFLDPHYKSSYYDQHVVGIHFYHNMIFIRKGFNSEESNRKDFK